MKKLLTALVLSCCAVAIVVAYQHTPAVREDCTRYTDSTIGIADRGERGWLLMRNDGAILAQLDDKADAEAALAVARRHSALCYIGRDNKRPDHAAYVMTYWK